MFGNRKKKGQKGINLYYPGLAPSLSLPFLEPIKARVLRSMEVKERNSEGRLGFGDAAGLEVGLEIWI